MPRPALAIAGIVEDLVHQPFIRVGSRIGHERADLLQRGVDAEQHEKQPAYQDIPWSFGREREPGRAKAFGDKGIDRCGGPARVAVVDVEGMGGVATG